jgi:hypothetical protein
MISDEIMIVYLNIINRRVFVTETQRARPGNHSVFVSCLDERVRHFDTQRGDFTECYYVITRPQFRHVGFVDQITS